MGIIFGYEKTNLEICFIPNVKIDYKKSNLLLFQASILFLDILNIKLLSLIAHLMVIASVGHRWIVRIVAVVVVSAVIPVVRVERCHTQGS